jgi:AcrR family transcriptional regulator
VGPKGEATRARIVDAALRLFTLRGFEDTTMRMIAAEAGVGLGNAYQYFAGKDHLVQAFYERSQVEHADAAAPLLAGTRDFGERLHGVLTARIDTMQPYRAFASSFFRTAADPDSPLSPFSPESAEPRAMSTAIYSEALEGSSLRVPGSLGARLPELLWLAQMGLILFWVHDRSPGSRRTYRLIDRAVPMAVRLVSLSRYRAVRPLIEDALDLLDEVGRQ